MQERKKKKEEKKSPLVKWTLGKGEQLDLLGFDEVMENALYVWMM